MDTGCGEMIIYQTLDAGIVLDVRLKGETIRLAQARMCRLFGPDQEDFSVVQAKGERPCLPLLFDKNINIIDLHLRNIFKDGELELG